MGEYLIVDAGGTSTKWCLCSPCGKLLQQRIGHGINAMVTPQEEIDSEIKEASSLIKRADAIYFYGAGCKGPGIDRIKKAIEAYAAPETTIEIYSDLIGAARALYGDESGIICIMGTGSNTGYYDSQTVTNLAPSLGFILGDEGSGTALAKRLIRSILRDEIKDEELRRAFFEQAGCTRTDIIEKIYRGVNPNRFMASLTPVISRYHDHADMRRIIDVELDALFENCLSKYKELNSNKLGFIGSIAAVFEQDIMHKCAHYGFDCHKIMQDPIEGLIKYHIK